MYVSDKFPVDETDIKNLLVKGNRPTSCYLDRTLPSDGGVFYAVTAMNRFGVESKPTAFNPPDTCTASVSFKCTGNIHVCDNVLHIDACLKSSFLLLEDETGRMVVKTPFARELPLSSLKRGTYTVRALNENGTNICLGKFERVN